MRLFFVKHFILFIFLSFSFLSFSEEIECYNEKTIDHQLAAKPYDDYLLTAKAKCFFDQAELQNKIVGNEVFIKNLLSYNPTTQNKEFYKFLQDLTKSSENINSVIESYNNVIKTLRLPPYDFPTMEGVGIVDNEEEDESVDFYKEDPSLLEAAVDLSIVSTYEMSQLYFKKYFYQVVSQNSRKIQANPSLKNKSQNLSYFLILPLVEDPLGPIDSLKFSEASAEFCMTYIKSAVLPEKYSKHLLSCKLLADFATDFSLLEVERMEALQTCEDVEKGSSKVCERLRDITSQILNKKNIIEKELY